jgi:hypothetical protein
LKHDNNLTGLRANTIKTASVIVRVDRIDARRAARASSQDRSRASPSFRVWRGSRARGVGAVRARAACARTTRARNECVCIVPHRPRRTLRNLTISSASRKDGRARASRAGVAGRAIDREIKLNATFLSHSSA